MHEFCLPSLSRNLWMQNGRKMRVRKWIDNKRNEPCDRIKNTAWTKNAAGSRITTSIGREQLTLSIICNAARVA